MNNEPLEPLRRKFDEMYAWWKTSEDRGDPGILYRGTILDNVDPEELGRVKVVIDGITAPATSSDSAKWAWTMNHFGGGQPSGIGYGDCNPFPIGSKVWILFEQSDSNYENPVVMGGFYQRDRIPQQIFDRHQEHVPRAWGWVTPKGHSILCREEDGEESIEIISQDDRRIIISNKKDNGMISILAKNGAEISIKETPDTEYLQMTDSSGDSVSIDKKTNTISLQAADTLIISAPNIQISGSTVTVVSGEDTVIASGGSMMVAGKGGTNVGSEQSDTSVSGLTLKAAGVTAANVSALTVEVSSTISTTIDSSAVVNINAPTVNSSPSP